MYAVSSALLALAAPVFSVSAFGEPTIITQDEPTITPAPLGYVKQGSGWPASGFDASAFASWTSAHPSEASWFQSYTSAHPSDPWPTSWPSGSAYPSGFINLWGTAVPTSGSDDGWGANGRGPWGSGAQGWGLFGSEGEWTAGPWTAWWGSDMASGGCPGASWSGWTSGAWSTDAPWTTWSGCSATTTATDIYTSTAESGMETTVTSYSFKIAKASGGSEIGNAAAGRDMAAVGALLSAAGAIVALL